MKWTLTCPHCGETFEVDTVEPQIGPLEPRDVAAQRPFESDPRD